MVGSTHSKFLVKVQNSNCWEKRLISDAQESVGGVQAVEFGEKTAILPVAARREGRVAGDTERMMDGIFVGHHERTGASFVVPFRAWIAKRYESSAENCRPTVGQ